MTNLNTLVLVTDSHKVVSQKMNLVNITAKKHNYFSRIATIHKTDFATLRLCEISLAVTFAKSTTVFSK